MGNRHTIYTRMNRWRKAGVLDRAFAKRPQEQIIALRIERVCWDSPAVQVHPDGTGALKKAVPRPWAVPGAGTPPSFLWWPRRLGVP